MDIQGERRFHGFRACPKGHPGTTIYQASDFFLRSVHGSPAQQRNRVKLAVKRSFTGPRDDSRCMAIALDTEIPDRAEATRSKALCLSARPEILSACAGVTAVSFG